MMQKYEIFLNRINRIIRPRSPALTNIGEWGLIMSWPESLSCETVLLIL